MADLGLSGLASGVDTAGLVEKLMAIERSGRTRLTFRQSAVGSQQTALRDLKAKLDALNAAAAGLRSPATWAETQTVESSDPARVVAARIGGAPIGGYSIDVRQLAASAQKTYGWTESAAATTLTLDDGAGGKAPVTLDIAAGAKIADVAAAINGRADLPVYAAVVGGDKLVLSSRATGATVDFSAAGAQLTGPSAEVSGRDAEFYVNGSTTLEKRASNVVEDAIPGVRLTFKGVTPAPADVVVGAPGVDRAKVKTAVKAFVDAYNAVVTNARAKVSEKRVGEAATATDFAKGQFFGDTGLNSLLSQLRLGASAVYGADAALDQLTDIGVSTGKAGATTEQSKAGLLALDDAKLTAALDADAEGVRRLLGGTSTAAFAQDVEKLTDGLSKALDGRVESIGRQSKRIADELTRTDTRLAAKEKRLKAQFAAMESALGASQTQMAWLQGQLAGLPSWS